MTRTRGRPAMLFLAAIVLFADPAALHGQATEYQGAEALGLALRRLGTTKRVLMIAAHPDDENTAVLSTLALRDGADVAYLSLTRGEGGQNLIGPELQEGLGLIRSEELLAARELDGARQFFTRAYDYGFSKSAEEAFSHWPRDSVLADVVAVVRRFRPDVIVSVFSGTPRDGHGQHEAAGIVARAAFEAAADAAYEGSGAPHRTRYLYQALYRPTGDEILRLQTGAYDPLLGRSHFQIAMASRSRHRSQDMGQVQPPGPRSSAFALLAGQRPAPGGSLFLGLDTTVATIDPAGGAQATGGTEADVVELLTAYQRSVAEIGAAYNPLRPEGLVPRLAEAGAILDDALRRLPPHASHARFLLEDERAELADALRLAAGIVFEATADVARIVPGEAFGFTLTLWNGGTNDIAIRSFEPLVPSGWSVEAVPDGTSPIAGNLTTVPAGSLIVRSYRVSVPADAQPSEPYFLRAPRTGDMYAWPEDDVLRGRPFEEPPVRAAVELEVAGQHVTHVTDAVSVTADKAIGELRAPLLVVPAVSVDVAPQVLALPLTASDDEVATDTRAPERGGGGAQSGAETGSRMITVTLRSAATDTLHGVLRIAPPPGWRADPASLRIALPGGAARGVEVRIAPAGAVTAGRMTFDASFTTDDDRTFDRGYRIIDYPHIQPRTLYAPARALISVMPAAIAPDLSIGYIEGAGDDGALALRQLGADVVALDSAMLATGDLSRFDAIVSGIRAYEVRGDLLRHNDRLLAYVRGGGTYVVQYNKYELVDGGFTPYPMTMARPHGRVTDESAPVRLLEPRHPALSWPNRIDTDDFAGWVHERGLYFADSWDAAYSPLLAMSDPGGEPLEGALLVAQHGRGHYVYTGLAFFRQLPEGVPGAYRLLANLVSLGRAPLP